MMSLVEKAIPVQVQFPWDGTLSGRVSRRKDKSLRRGANPWYLSE